MIIAALRDLQWRRRRFLIAVLGTGLVFALSLMVAGLATAFRTEADRWLTSTGAELFVTKQGTAGPFTVIAPFPAARASEVQAVPGVERADPMIFARATMAPANVDVNTFGIVPGGLGSPKVVEGRGLEGPGEIVANDSLGRAVGEELVLNGTPFTVVGLARHSTLVIGAANVFITLPDAQKLFLGGLPLTTSLLVRGETTVLPEGLTGFDRSQARDDLLRPLGDALRSIELLRVLLWIVAALIVGSVVYLTAIERTRDFAVFKAVGWSTGALGAGLALQSVVLAVAAAVVGTLLAIPLAPLFPLPVELPTTALAWLPVTAVAVGLLACLVGLRRAVAVQPAAAFGGP